MEQFFATVARGVEKIAAKELESLGAQDIRPDYCGVYFQGDRQFVDSPVLDQCT